MNNENAMLLELMMLTSLMEKMQDRKKELEFALGFKVPKREYSQSLLKEMQ